MRNNNTPNTVLLRILRQLGTHERRHEFAVEAQTSVLYLYQLAGCHRGSCRTTLAQRIAKASQVMHERYGSDVATIEQIADMCTVGR